MLGSKALKMRIGSLTALTLFVLGACACSDDKATSNMGSDGGAVDDSTTTHLDQSSSTDGTASNVTIKKTQEVGQTGGEVETQAADGDIKITIPADALDEKKVIEVGETKNAPALTGGEAVGEAIHLGPSGTTFSKPITVTFTYKDEKLPAEADESQLKVYTYVEAEQKWQWIQDYQVDVTNNTISVQVTHFSLFLKGLPPNPQAGIIKGEATLNYNNENPMDLFKFSTQDIKHATSWETFNSAGYDIGHVGGGLWAPEDSAGGLVEVSPQSLNAVGSVPTSGYEKSPSMPSDATGKYYAVKCADGKSYAVIKITADTDNGSGVAAFTFSYVYQPAKSAFFSDAPVIESAAYNKTSGVMSVAAKDANGQDDIVLVTWQDSATPTKNGGKLLDDGASPTGSEPPDSEAGDGIYSTKLTETELTFPISIFVHDKVGHTTSFSIKD